MPEQPPLNVPGADFFRGQPGGTQNLRLRDLVSQASQPELLPPALLPPAVNPGRQQPAGMPDFGQGPPGGPHPLPHDPSAAGFGVPSGPAPPPPTPLPPLTIQGPDRYKNPPQTPTLPQLNSQAGMR